MLLSRFAGPAGVIPDRDGSFQNLGFLTEQSDGMLSFVETEQFLPTLLRNPFICAVLTTPQLASKIPSGVALGICEQPRLAFARLHNCLAASEFYWNNAPTIIHPDARIHPRAWVAEQNVTVGAHTVVGPNATVLERSVIGAHVVISAGAVLGGVGFQTARTAGIMLEMSHAGGLVVHDGAQILHGAVIATGLFRNNTVVGRDARIGAQSFLSHGVQVGERAFVGHGSVINGNVVIGRETWIGPGAVVAQNLEVAENAFVSLGAIAIRNVPAGERVSGNFAVPHWQLLRALAKLDPDGELP